MFQLFIMVNIAWMLPYRLAFSKAPTGVIAIIFDIFIDLTVWADMFLQMKMYIYDTLDGILITDPRQIKSHYLKSWFTIDFFSVVPADQVLYVVGQIMLANSTNRHIVQAGDKCLQLSVEVRLLRLLRLVRLAKIKQLLRIEHIIASLHKMLKGLGISKLQVAFYFRIFFLVWLILFAAHCLGCVWLLIGRHNVLKVDVPVGWMQGVYGQDSVNHTKDFVSCSGEDFSAEAWNSVHGSSCKLDEFSCAPIPENRPYNVDCSWIRNRMTPELGGTGDADYVGASESTQYVTAFYFSLVTVTTVGYGDVLPDTYEEKMFVVFAIMLGAFLYAFIIGDFSTLIANMSQERSEFDSHMRHVNNLLTHIHAGPDLRNKVYLRAAGQRRPRPSNSMAEGRITACELKATHPRTPLPRRPPRSREKRFSGSGAST
jgi:hypothetical protein